VCASYLELYNEEVRDLLARDPSQSKLQLKESPERGVYVKGLMQFVVKGVPEITRVLQVGQPAGRLHQQGQGQGVRAVGTAAPHKMCAHEP
jgi:hypothetical protein